MAKIDENVLQDKRSSEAPQKEGTCIILAMMVNKIQVKSSAFIQKTFSCRNVKSFLLKANSENVSYTFCAILKWCVATKNFKNKMKYFERKYCVSERM